MSGTPLKVWLANRGIDPRLFNAWHNMKCRCKPTYKQHADYFDRGITVCREWERSFETFAADMGPHPGAGYTLDRERNHEGYSKSNCRWATRAVQQQNRRANVLSRADVKAIRARRDRGERTCDIVRALGFPQRLVYHVVLDQIWKGV